MTCLLQVKQCSSVGDRLLKVSYTGGGGSQLFQTAPLSFQQVGLLDNILSSALTWTTHAVKQTHTHSHTQVSLISNLRGPPLLLNLETRSVIVLPLKMDEMALKTFQTSSSYSDQKPGTVKMDESQNPLREVSAQCSF